MALIIFHLWTLRMAANVWLSERHLHYTAVDDRFHYSTILVRFFARRFICMPFKFQERFHRPSADTPIMPTGATVTLSPRWWQRSLEELQRSCRPPLCAPLNPWCGYGCRDKRAVDSALSRLQSPYCTCMLCWGQIHCNPVSYGLPKLTPYRYSDLNTFSTPPGVCRG